MIHFSRNLLKLIFLVLDFLNSAAGLFSRIHTRTFCYDQVRNPNYDEGGAKNKDSLVVLLLYLNINEGHVLELPSHCS